MGHNLRFSQFLKGHLEVSLSGIASVWERLVVSHLNGVFNLMGLTFTPGLSLTFLRLMQGFYGSDIFHWGSSDKDYGSLVNSSCGARSGWDLFGLWCEFRGSFIRVSQNATFLEKLGALKVFPCYIPCKTTVQNFISHLLKYILAYFEPKIILTSKGGLEFFKEFGQPKNKGFQPWNFAQ